VGRPFDAPEGALEKKNLKASADKPRREEEPRWRPSNRGDVSLVSAARSYAARPRPFGTRLEEVTAMRALTSCLAFALLAGCGAAGPSVESVARHRAMNEYDCPDALVSVYPVSGPTVRVNACGHESTYTCPWTPAGRFRFDRYCIRESPSK
jgi:hypothetical protein